MTEKQIRVKRLILRNDDSRNWQINNPTLLRGEIGVENDTNRIKIGDGTNSWNKLRYIVDPNNVFKGKRINGIMFDGSKDIEIKAAPTDHLHSINEIKELDARLQQMMHDIMKQVHDNIEGIGSKIPDKNEIGQIIKDEVSKVEDRFFQELQYQLGRIEEDIQNGILTQEEAHNRLDKIIAEVDKHINEELQKDLEEIQQELEDAQQRLDEAITEAKKHIYEEVIKEIENAQKELGQASEEVKKEIQEAEDRLNQALEDAHAEIDENIKQQLENIKQQLEVAKQDINNTDNKINSAIQDVENRLDGQIQNQLDSIRQEIGNGYATKAEIEQQIQDAITNAEGSLSGAIDEIKGGITDKINEIIAELNKAPTESGYKSINELQKTATSLSNTIATNKQTQDGINQTHLSQIQQTEKGVETIVANLNKDAAGNEYKAIADLKIEADGIKSIVSKNKNDTDKTLSSITQRADNIESLVAINKKDTDSSLSQITQKADSITSLVESNRKKQDEINMKLSSWLRQTAENVNIGVQKVEDELNKGNGDCRYKAIAHLNIKADEISSIVATEKRNNDQRYEEAMSKISQTAESIKATIQQNKQDQDGTNSQNSSQIQQAADSIQVVVNGLNSDAKGNKFGSISSLSMRADEISSTVARNKNDTDKAFSSLTQKSDSIVSLVNLNKQIQENKNQELSSLIEQKADGINLAVKKVENELNEDGDKCSYRSIATLNMKADQISSTVQSTNQRIDETEKDISRIEQKADSITLTVSKLQSNQYGDKVQLSSNIKQSADKIEANLNKTGANSPYVAITSLYATAEELSRTVAQHKEKNDKNNQLITDKFSQIKQTADSIQLLVESNQKAQDIENKRLASMIQQGPTGVNVVVEELQKDYNNCEYKAISSLKIKTNEISSAISENKRTQEQINGQLINKDEELRSLITQSSGGVDVVIEELQKDCSKDAGEQNYQYRAIATLKARADGVDSTVATQGENINTALSKIQQNSEGIKTIVADLGNQNLEELGNKYKAISAIVQKADRIESTVSEKVQTNINAGLDERINGNIDAKVNEYDRKLEIEKFSKITQESGRISALVEENKTKQDEVNAAQQKENERLASLIEMGPGGVSVAVENIKNELNKDGTDGTYCSYKAISSLKITADGLRSDVTKFQKNQNGINQKNTSSIQQNELGIKTIVADFDNQNLEELGKKYKAISAIVQKADGIQATVTEKVTNDINQSIDGKIDDKIKTNNTVIEEKIANVNIRADGIESIVTENKTTQDTINNQQIAENKRLESLIQQGPSGVNVVVEQLGRTCDACEYRAISTLNVKADGINSTVSSIQTGQDQLLADLNIKDIDGPEAQAALQKYSTISSINQKADSISSTVSDLSKDTSSRFEQTANSISGIITGLGGKDEITGQFKEIASLKASATRIDSTVARVDEIQGTVNTVNDDVKKLKADYSTVSQTADTIQTLVTRVDTTDKNVNNTLNKANEAIDSANLAAGNANAALETVNKKVSMIQQNADSITAVVSSLNEVGGVPCNYNAITSIRADIEGLTSTVQAADSNATSAINRVSTIEQTAEAIKLRVDKQENETNKKLSAQIAQTSTSIQSVVNELNKTTGRSAYSAINQLKDEINLKVGADEVVSAINLSPAEIKISGKKIILDGDTVINGKIIKDGMIDNNAVGPNTIQSGAITADKIDITGGKTGARIEILENLIIVYDANGVARVKLGIWE